MTTLVDITVLGPSAFTTSSSSDQSLGDILQSKDIIKVFFDIRNDSDALFSLYGIRVQGIEDVQLMELASRSFSKRCVHGLAKCIEKDARITFTERRRWQDVKKRGQSLFNPAQGGDFAVFDQRPLSPDLREYCVQDVCLMPGLRQLYREKLCDAWWEKIVDETQKRITLSQSASFNGQGRDMAEGPRQWLTWRPTALQRRERGLLQDRASAPNQSTEASLSSSQSSSASESNDAHVVLGRLNLDDASGPSEPSESGVQGR